MARAFQAFVIRHVSWALIVLAGLMLAGGGALDVLSDSRALSAAEGWSRATAWVESVENERYATRSRTAYIPQVAYAYDVGGRRYRNGDVYLNGGPHLSQAASAAILARFPPGGDVPVYYDPADPQRAVLIREIGREDHGWVLIFIGVPPLLLGLLLRRPLIDLVCNRVPWVDNRPPRPARRTKRR